MSSELFVASDVIQMLDSLRGRERQQLIAIFEKIRTYPGNCRDYAETGADGRSYDVHVCGKYAIRYWNDLTDRQIRILKLSWAERGH